MVSVERTWRGRGRAKRARLHGGGRARATHRADSAPMKAFMRALRMMIISVLADSTSWFSARMWWMLAIRSSVFWSVAFQKAVPAWWRLT